MIPSDTGERRADAKTSLLERLHDPVQLRICVMSAALLVGYLTIYMPLSEMIADTTRKLARDRRLLDVARSLEHLQEQYQSFQGRLPEQTDAKEWVQYVIQGTRQFPLKMNDLKCLDPKTIGPYTAVAMRMELEGSYPAMDKFLEWLETNHRLFRADNIAITRPIGGEHTDVLVMKLTVLGLTG